MNRAVLVDTCVWSLALRRVQGSLGGADLAIVGELAELIRHGRAQLAGMVRQELLTGIRRAEQFARLQHDLRAFPDPRLDAADYEAAASAANACRARGVSGSAVDFLLCAVALRRGWAIFTTDRDFAAYALHLPIHLHATGQ